MKVIDTRGKLCPLPLIMLKKAVDGTPVGEEIAVMTDNETAKGNLRDYIRELGATATEQEEDGYTTLTFRVTMHIEEPAPATCPTVTAPATAKGDYVIVARSNKMGRGEDELGSILMRAFVNAIGELDRLPSHIILYNSGVLLAVEGSDTADTLAALNEQHGIPIIVCGTCADYFEVKERLRVGTISNMYRIMQLQAEADHVLYP